MSAATASVTAFLSIGGRHQLGGVGLCCHGRISQIYGIEGEKRDQAVAPALSHRLCGMGAGRSAAENGNACDHRNRPENRRAFCAEPVQHGVHRPDRVLRCGRDDPDHERRPDRVPRPQRHTSEPGGDDPCRGFPAGWAPLWTRAPLSRSLSIWLTGKSARLSSGSALGGTPTTPSTWYAASGGRCRARGARGGLGILESHPGRGAG